MVLVVGDDDGVIGVFDDRSESFFGFFCLSEDVGLGDGVLDGLF